MTDTRRRHFLKHEVYPIWHPLPQLHSPIIPEIAAWLKEIGKIETTSQPIQRGVANGVIPYGIGNGSICVVPQTCRSRGAVENSRLEISKRHGHQRSEHLRFRIPEGVVQPRGGAPADTVGLRETEICSPRTEEVSDSRYVLTPLGGYHCPGRQITSRRSSKIGREHLSRNRDGHMVRVWRDYG